MWRFFSLTSGVWTTKRPCAYTNLHSSRNAFSEVSFDVNMTGCDVTLIVKGILDFMLFMVCSSLELPASPVVMHF